MAVHIVVGEKLGSQAVDTAPGAGGPDAMDVLVGLGGVDGAGARP